MSQPVDPRCPECGEPVSATARYCLHCKADLDQRSEAADGVNTTPDSTPTPEPSVDDTGLLAPDSVLDDSLTVLVGIVAGAIIGVLSLVILALGTLHWLGLLAASLVWIGSTAYLTRRRTVRDALRVSAYAVAVLLVIVPAVSFSGAMKGGTFGGQVVLFVIGEVISGSLGVVVALVGYSLERNEAVENQ